MKGRITAVMVGLLLALSANAHAASPFNYNNWFFESDGCSTFTPNTPAPANNTALCLDRTSGSIYVGYSSGWTLFANALTAPGAIGGVTPAAGTFTTLTATTTSVASASTDKALNVSNGGHISNPIGTGTAPTTGTGSVTAGGTDTAAVVTGGTSPVTVTFGTAFAVAPICVCSDVTSNHACSVGTVGTGSFIVTTTSTDTFMYVCIGK